MKTEIENSEDVKVVELIESLEFSLNEGRALTLGQFELSTILALIGDRKYAMRIIKMYEGRCLANHYH